MKTVIDAKNIFYRNSMKKQTLIDSYFKKRRLNTDIYAESYRGGMDDFFHVPFSVGEIKERWQKRLSQRPDEKIDFYIHIPFCYTICKYCDYYKTRLGP